MYTPQTIVIIGVGEMGRALAYAMAAGNDRVLLCDEEMNTKNLIDDLQQNHPYYDVEATNCSYDASWEADLIILDLPCAALLEAAGRIKAVANQKVVVSADTVQALQELLPNSKVVQAFDNIEPPSFYLSAEEKKQIDCFVRGDHIEAVITVSSLIKTIGFNPVIRPKAETSIEAA